MIPLELSRALALYSLVLGIVIAAIWVYTEISVKRPQRYLGKQFLWKCLYCGYTYLDERAERASRCPRCESFNTLGEQRRDPRLDAAIEHASRDASAAPRNTSKRKRPHQRRRGPRKRR